VASAVALVRLAVATGLMAVRLATLAAVAVAVAVAMASVAPGVLPGAPARQARVREQLVGLVARLMAGAAGPGGRRPRAAAPDGLAGQPILRGRADGLAGPSLRTVAPGQAAVMVPARPSGRAGPMAGVQVSGLAGRTRQVRPGAPGRRARTRVDGSARVKERARSVGRAGRTPRSGGRGPSGAPIAPMVRDPPAAGTRAETRRGAVGGQSRLARGRARRKVTPAVLSGARVPPTAEPTASARRGPVLARAAMTGQGTGEAVPDPGPARGGTTSQGTGEAVPDPGPARGAGPCPDKRRADGTQTDLPRNPPATRRTAAGRPGLTGLQERAPAAGRASMQPPVRQPGRTRSPSGCQQCRTASRLTNSMLTHVLNSGPFPPISPMPWRASWWRRVSTRTLRRPICTPWRLAAWPPGWAWSVRPAGSRHTRPANGRRHWPNCGPRDG